MKILKIVKKKLYRIEIITSFLLLISFSKNNNIIGKIAHITISFMETILISLTEKVSIKNLEKIFVRPALNIDMITFIICFFMILNFKYLLLIFFAYYLDFK